jgi:hypothetical protein
MSSCSNDYDCGDHHLFHYTEMIFARANNNGKYYLKIVAVYGNETKESYKTAHKYTIEELGKICFLLQKTVFLLIIQHV